MQVKSIAECSKEAFCNTSTFIKLSFVIKIFVLSIIDWLLSEDYIKNEPMTKAPVKFQKSQHKLVGGVAHTRYPVSSHFYNNKCIKSTCEKSQLVKKVTKVL